MNKGIVDSIGVEVTIAPNIETTGATVAANGIGVDVSGFEAAGIVVVLGAVTGAATDVDVALQDSDDDVTYAAVASDYYVGDTLTGLGLANANLTLKQGYIGGKKYLRAVATGTVAGGANFPYAVLVVEGSPRHAPVVSPT